MSTSEMRAYPWAVCAALALSLAEHRPHHPDDDHLFDLIKAALKGAGIHELERHERDLRDAGVVAPRDIIEGATDASKDPAP